MFGYFLRQSGMSAAYQVFPQLLAQLHHKMK
jgi:hypothetical protein